MNSAVTGILVLILAFGVLIVLAQNGFFNVAQYTAHPGNVSSTTSGVPDNWLTRLFGFFSGKPALPAGFISDQISARYHGVRFNQVIPGKGDTDVDQVVLQSQATTTLNVTGWYLQSNHGLVLLPQGRDVSDVGDIVILDMKLTNNQTIEIHSLRGSVGGPVSAVYTGAGWRVTTGSKFLDANHDRVFLFDSKGKLVDEYKY